MTSDEGKISNIDPYPTKYICVWCDIYKLMCSSTTGTTSSTISTVSPELWIGTICQQTRLNICTRIMQNRTS